MSFGSMCVCAPWGRGGGGEGGSCGRGSNEGQVVVCVGWVGEGRGTRERRKDKSTNVSN